MNQSTTRIQVVAWGFLISGIWRTLMILYFFLVLLAPRMLYGIVTSIWNDFDSLVYWDGILIKGALDPLSLEWFNELFFLLVGFFLAILPFKIRSSLLKLDVRGYQAALIYLGALVIESMIYFFEHVIFFISFFVVMIAVYLLYSRRRLFIDFHSSKSLIIFVVAALVLFYGGVPLFDKIERDIERKQIIEKNRDPFDAMYDSMEWEPYINTEYNFSLEVPKGWYREEYSAENSERPEEKYTIIAFNNVPFLTGGDEVSYYQKESFSYFYIRIFPVTNAKQYSEFRSNFPYAQEEVDLGGISGVLNRSNPSIFVGSNELVYQISPISVEFNGFVYELPIRDSVDDDGKSHYSFISQHILDTFIFINEDDERKFL